MIRTSFRLPTKMIERLDALIPTFSSRAAKATRADVLRILIQDALPLAEAEAKEQPPRPGGASRLVKHTPRPRVKRSR